MQQPGMQSDRGYLPEISPRSMSYSERSSSPEAGCPHSEFKRKHGTLGLWAPISTFIQNASACIDCEILLKVIEATTPGWSTENKHQGAVELGIDTSFAEPVALTIRMGIKGSETSWGIFEEHDFFQFHLFELSPCPIYNGDSSAMPWTRGGILRSLQVNVDSGSSAAFDRAKQWLSHCVQNDAPCRPQDASFMPRHLINVGSSHELQEPFLFKPSVPVQYACLSYCWGVNVDQNMKTTTNNIQSHYRKLELAKLPATIQDAIKVCRALDIPNLWVDSLCIVQNDRNLWLKDASTMHDVYRNSHLTIAIMEPNSCQSSFLGKQQFGDPSWQRLFCPELSEWSDSKPPSLLIRPGEFKSRSDRDRSSLDKRGWCLQESILPNRRLCYDGNEMLWECMCRQICECGHVVRPGSETKTSKDYNGLGTMLKTHMPGAEPPRDRIFQMRRGYRTVSPYFKWRELVVDYSHRSFSQKNDVLRAISALAELVQNRLLQHNGFPDEYVAGLWKDELHFDLAWFINYEDEDEDEDDVPSSLGLKDESESNYRIPSWSWASVGKPVSFPLTDDFETWKYEPEAINAIEIGTIDCKRELPNDPTSAVIGGSLVLKGSFVTVKYLGGDDGKVVNPKRGQSWGSISLDSGLTTAKDNQYDCFRLFDLVGYTRGSWVPRMGPKTTFLVLTKSTYKEGAFERIGIGFCGRDDEKKSSLFGDDTPVTVEIV